MSLQGKHFYEFGPFQLDAEKRVLWCASEPVALPPKVTETLLVMVRNHGELVEKEELMKAVWPDTFVEEANLAVHVSTLRKLFEERANGEPFIETIPRRGYRFVAAVVEHTEANRGPSSAAAAEAAVSAPRSRTAAALIVGAIVLVVALVAGSAIRRAGPSAASARQIHSVAVLPLQNLSGDTTQDFLADGLTEALVTDLAQIRALRVISRTSVMTYKGTKKKLPEIARELNVDAVVEGAVVRSGDRVRVTAQLIEAPTDRHLWAQTYDGDIHDLLRLESQVAQAIAQQVRVALTPEEKMRLATVHLVNPDAHEAYLQGRYFWNKRSPDFLRKSLELYEKAIRIDPNSAETHAAMASVYVTMLGSDQFPPREMEAKARRAAEKALSIDETLAEPHAVLAMVKAAEDYDWDGSDAEFRRAFELDPNLAVAHHWYGYMLIARGRNDEAYQEVQKASQLDPLNQATVNAVSGALAGWRKFDACVARARKLLELDPNSYYAYWSIGDCSTGMKKYDDAIAAYRETLRISPHTLGIICRLGYVLALAGRKSEARAQLREIELSQKSGYSSGALRAFVHIGLGDRERAIELLLKDYENRSIGVLLFRSDFHFDSLRPDPRFQALVKKAGLE